jgi:hypothetical protein
MRRHFTRISCEILNAIKKGKVVLVHHDMKAYWWNEGIAPLIL